MVVNYLALIIVNHMFIVVNYLLIESLLKLHEHFGSQMLLKNVPGHQNCDLKTFAKVICQRLVSLFVPDKNGRRLCHRKSRDDVSVLTRNFTVQNMHLISVENFWTDCRPLNLLARNFGRLLGVHCSCYVNVVHKTCSILSERI